MANNLELGSKGEDWACQWLVERGYEVITRNYRMGKAEIDIIARKENLLVFLEVKARTNLQFGDPEGAVTPAKIKLIQSAAEQYILETDWLRDIRFDIIAISVGKGREIIHIEDAF